MEIKEMNIFQLDVAIMLKEFLVSFSQFSFLA